MVIYNSKRLNGALFYLTPDEYFEGKKEIRLEEKNKKTKKQKNKLHNADVERKAYWIGLNQTTLLAFLKKSKFILSGTT